MKCIINGKMYNTDTAAHVASHSNGCDCSDLQYVEEKLYIKKTGEWFLYGKGGAGSKYSVARGKWWRGGSRIIPYTTEEAMGWLAENNFVDEYIKYFGEPEEKSRF